MTFKLNKISVVIAARMGSSRFPGKTLETLYSNKTMIECLIERVEHSNYVDEIILATTNLKEDDVLENWASLRNIKIYRGSSEDVLERIYQTAKKFEAKTVVKILGDNPLIHCDLIDSSIKLFFEKGCDYVATLTNEYPKANLNLARFPIGVRVQVISFDSLQKCNFLSKEINYREHALSFIAHHPELFNIEYVTASNMFSRCERPNLTFAVNKKANLSLIRNIYQYYDGKKVNFDLNDILEAFDTNPDWLQLMGNNA